MTKVITIQQFTRDLWEAQRKEMRKALENAVAPEDLDKSFPPWEKLDENLKREKQASINEDLLKWLDQAGYEVHQKQPTNGRAPQPTTHTTNSRRKKQAKALA